MRSALALLVLPLLLFGLTQTSAQESVSLAQIQVPKGSDVTRYERIADIPEKIRNAAQKQSCKLNDNDLRLAPVLVFRPAVPAGMQSGFVVLVSCQNIVGRSYMFWASHPSQEPEPMSFPIMSFPTGFGATKSPGFLEWNAESQTLTARQGTDMCPDIIRRYTYQFGFNLSDRDDRPSWRLLKVEDAPFKCIDDVKWEVVWEAAHWPVPQKPK